MEMEIFHGLVQEDGFKFLGCFGAREWNLGEILGVLGGETPGDGGGGWGWGQSSLECFFKQECLGFKIVGGCVIFLVWGKVYDELYNPIPPPPSPQTKKKKSSRNDFLKKRPRQPS